MLRLLARCTARALTASLALLLASQAGCSNSPEQDEFGITVTPGWTLDDLKQPRDFRGHSGPVEEVAMSANGQRVVSYGRDNTIRLWNVETGKEQRKIDLPFKPPQKVLSVVFFNDCSECLICWTDWVNNDWVFKYTLWNLASGEKGKFDGDPETRDSLAVSADGKRALCGGPGGILVRQLPDGKVLRRIEDCKGKIRGLAFSPDGKLAAATLDNDVVLLDLVGTQPARKLSGHQSPPSRVVFSSKGLLISGGYDGVVRVWDPAKGTEVRALGGNTGIVLGLAFSPDGKLAVSGDGAKDNKARVWEVNTGMDKATFSEHTAGVTSVAFSANGKWVLSGSQDGSVRLRPLAK